MRLRSVVLLIGLVLGCTSIKFVQFDSIEREPSAQVAIFSTPDAVKREYVEIGLLTAGDEGWGQSEADLIGKLQKKAMEVGADAIILQSGEIKAGGYVAVGNIWFASNERVVRVVAIKFVDDSLDTISDSLQ